MMPRMILVGIVVSWAAVCLALPEPPAGAVTRVSGQVTYYSGTVYLSAHEDTSKLKDLGFRNFAFDSRSFGSLKYKAEWPDSALSLPLPDYLNGMNYDVAAQVTPTTPASSSAITPVGVSPRDVGSINMKPTMGMDSATARRFLAQLDVRVRTINRPENSKTGYFDRG